MYQVRLDTYTGWNRIKDVEADSYEVIEGGFLVFIKNGINVATFANGKWVYVELIT